MSAGVHDAVFVKLLFIYHLENIKFQIIRLISSPQNRMVWRLCPKFHLTQSFMYIFCRLMNGFRKQFIGHKMRTGAGCQKSAILN